MSTPRKNSTDPKPAAVPDPNLKPEDGPVNPLSGLPDDPIITLPPIEMYPESVFWAHDLAENRDWGHGPLQLEAVHAAGHLGEGAVVAICDTGIDDVHPDLKGKVIASKDFTGSGSAGDKQGHGTHCAGIATAASDGNGIIGAAPLAKLVRAKVLGDTGSGASSWIAAGMKFGADNGAQIISLSLGGPQKDPYTEEALDYCIARGCWVVAAAGNDGRPAISFPGHLPKMIAVAATDKDNRRATFSTQNAQNDVGAPGVQILSTLPGGRYGNMSGTSMATPYVAGCLAVLRAAIIKAGRPVPTQLELLAAIKETAVDIAPPGIDADTGAGLLNLPALLAKFVGSGGPVDPPPPPPPPPPPDGGAAGYPANFGISYGITTPWTKQPDGSVVASGTFSMRITKQKTTEVPKLEDIMANIFVPQQQVEWFGMPIPKMVVPPFTVQGPAGQSAVPGDWLGEVLDKLCSFGPQLPEPINHAVALICWFLKQSTPGSVGSIGGGAGSTAVPDILKKALEIICMYRSYIPTPYRYFLDVVCMLLGRGGFGSGQTYPASFAHFASGANAPDRKNPCGGR